MRHFFRISVAHLAPGMRTPSAPAPLVPPPRLSLARPTTVPRALRPAVPRASDVTHRAQKDGSAALRSLADDDVQRDHGPRRRRRARLPRGPVPTRMGRTATSRSRGAIEGPEPQSPGPRYLGVAGRCTASLPPQRLSDQRAEEREAPTAAPFAENVRRLARSGATARPTDRHAGPTARPRGTAAWR